MTARSSSSRCDPGPAARPALPHRPGQPGTPPRRARARARRCRGRDRGGGADADGLAASPGSKAYGALSVGVQAVCRVERLFTVRAGAFTPPPKVRSAVVRLTPLAQPLVAPEEIAAFRAFVTACFTRRRKQLRNVVMTASGRSAALVGTGLRELGLDPAARPETLGAPEFARLLRWSARL